jgi:hypothetical protein
MTELAYLKPSDQMALDRLFGRDQDAKGVLEKVPGVQNWVDRVGGFPPGNWIYRCAIHLHAKGFTVGHALAVAINAAKKACSTGDLNWPGWQGINMKSRAECCAAVAQWEAMKARA